MGSSFETLGLELMMRVSAGDEEQQGRLAMDGQWRRRVSISIAGGGERDGEERERRESDVLFTSRKGVQSREG